MATHRQQRPRIADSVLVLVQFLTALTWILVLFALGPPLGTLDPLLSLNIGGGLFAFVQVLLYAAVLGIVGLAGAGSETDRLSARGGDADSVWEYIPLSAILGAGAGAAIGAGLVYAVPAELSTQLPLLALSMAAVAFVLVGNALPVRGFDTASSAIGATIYAFVLPIALLPRFGALAIFLAAGVGIPALVAVREWFRAAGPLDRRVTVPIAVLLVLASGGALAHDLNGPQPTVSLDTTSSANLSTPDERWYAVSDNAERREMVRLGTVTARNEFGFARTVRLPGYDACLYADGRLRERVPVSVVEPGSTVSPVWEQRLAGNETRQFAVVLLYDDFADLSTDDLSGIGEVSVRRADQCPATTDGPALVVVPDADGQ